MKHEVVIEVTMLIDQPDQAYAATEAEHRLFAVADCQRVRVIKAQKQIEAPKDNNYYGVTNVEKPVIKVVETPHRRDPGVSFTMVGTRKEKVLCQK